MHQELSAPYMRRLYRIAWPAVRLLLQLLWGAWFSLAVSAPDTGVGKILVFAMAFGGFAWAAGDSFSGIRKVLARAGMTTFATQAATVVCLISLTTLALNLAGTLADRPLTPETQSGNSVSGTSATQVQNSDDASDASKRTIVDDDSGTSARCHPAEFTQQELTALILQATNGNAQAQCILGDSYYDGKGVSQDYAQAASWWSKSAEQGVADAQYNLGNSYYNGEGVPQDYIKAAFWVRKAAEQGLVRAQDMLGVLYGNGEGMPQDYVQAELWFRKAAERGDAHAQYNLGSWYQEGKYQGVPQDDAQAAFWRRKIRAWRAYIHSIDFRSSEHWRYTQAAFWYRKAAEQGDADAQVALGDLDSNKECLSQDDDGECVTKDYEDYSEAAHWYRKAAEQGDSDAQESLGDLYLNGQGVPQDYAEASIWLRKAAEQGNVEALESLGDLYLHGQGVPRDYAEAYFWYDLAAAEKDVSDSKQVAKSRDEAASHLTPADLFLEQGRAGKWFETHQAKP